MIDCSYIFIKRHTTIPFLNTGGCSEYRKESPKKCNDSPRLRKTS